METEILTGFALIFFAGLIGQWMAWRFQLPSILLLLIFGFILGPVTGLLDVNRIFGSILVPLVSISVAIILFEGGLNLNRQDLKSIGKEVRNLLSVGVLFSLILISLSAHYFLNLDWPLSIFLSSILVVTGPTVIIPLLSQIRPKSKVSSILRWEGIVIDPIGVMLAVLVFEVILLEDPFQVPALTLIAILKTAIIGAGIGYFFSWVLKHLLKNHLIPDSLQNAFALTFVVVAFVVSNLFQEGSGLLTVTIMGILLANQKLANIEKIIEFKENLQVLIISSLFIILASKLKLSDLTIIDKNSSYFLASLIFVIRPLSVFISTWKGSLNWKEKLFLMWMAPRGIVAAMIVSVFAVELANFGYPEFQQLIPIVFLVILVTVAVYGLTSGPLAYLLKLADPNPQGILIVGAHDWAIQIAKFLKNSDFKIKMVDTNAQHIFNAKNAEIDAVQANILAESIVEEFNFNDIGKLLAITSNGEVNAMSALRFSSLFGRAHVYQLSTEHKYSQGKKEMAGHLRGRILFSSGMTYEFIAEQISKGAQIKMKKMSSEDQKNPWKPQSLEIPLFLIDSSRGLQIFAMDNAPTLKSGQTLIYLDCTQTYQEKLPISAS